MLASQRSHALVEDQDIAACVRALFGATGMVDEGVRLVVKVGGRAVSDPSALGGSPDTVDDGTREAIRELTQSLAMYGGGVAITGDTAVATPPVETIARALRVLADPSVRRTTLGAALTIFGKRVVAPLERMLASDELGPTARLETFRANTRQAIEGLGFTHETTAILRGDLDKLLTDEYLTMVGEYEEKTLRPRLRELAHRVMELLAAAFYRALDSFGTHVEAISQRIARTLPAQTALRNVPALLKHGFVEAVSDFMEVETSAELTGSLTTLSSQYSDVVYGERVLSFAQDWYRDLARECWEVIARTC